MKTYETSHPWLKFAIRLGDIGPEFWLLLGEASSKCEHLSQVPLRPETAQKLHQLYLARLRGLEGSMGLEGLILRHQAQKVCTTR